MLWARKTLAVAACIMVQGGCQLFLGSDSSDRASGKGVRTAYGPAEDFARDQQNPFAIVVDAKAAYWLNGASGDKPGSMMKFARTGIDDAPTILAAALATPVGLAQDGTRLFVAANLNDGGGDYQLLYRQPKDGGKAAQLQVQANQILFGVTVTGGEAFFALQPFDARAPSGVVSAISTDTWTTTGAREIANDTMGSMTSVTLLAAGSDHVYAATNGQILRVANTTHGPESLFASTEGFTAKAILLDGGVVYWIEGSRIRALATDKIGQTPTVLAEAQSDPRGLAVHGGEIFWTNAGDGSVWHASKSDGAGATAIAAGGEGEPYGIAVAEDGSVFWTNRADARIRTARPTP